MCKRPSDPYTTEYTPQVPTPAYLAPEQCTSLWETLVDLEAYLLDGSLQRATYALLQEPADVRGDAAIARQMSVHTGPALVEEPRLLQEGKLLVAATKHWHVQDKVDFETSAYSAPSSSSSSMGAPFRPALKPRKKTKPYDRPATPLPPPLEFVEFSTQDKHGTKSALGENECWVHSIDWVNAPPTWDGEAIPPIPADEMLHWLNHNYGIFKKGECKMDSCRGRQFDKGASLKSHLLSRKHLNLRRKCHLCGFAVRRDMFVRRHVCKVRGGRDVKEVQRNSGLPAP